MIIEALLTLAIADLYRRIVRPPKKPAVKSLSAVHDRLVKRGLR